MQIKVIKLQKNSSAKLFKSRIDFFQENETNAHV